MRSDREKNREFESGNPEVGRVSYREVKTLKMKVVTKSHGT